MTKYFCDRCGIETEYEVYIKLMDNIRVLKEISNICKPCQYKIIDFMEPIEKTKKVK